MCSSRVVAQLLTCLIIDRLELIVWLVPSLAGGAIAVSLIGIFLGPIYPIVMNHSARVLPPWLLTGCIGWIAGFGQAGSAFIPFLTGAIASSRGIQSLQPLCAFPPCATVMMSLTFASSPRMVAMMAFMFLLWAMVPNKGRRLD